MIKVKELQYPLNALEPYYNKETLDIHYNILYKGYVDNTNKTQEKLEQARTKGEFANIKCLEKDLSFFGSGVILHELFFENMGPAIPTSPDNKLTLWGCKPLLVLDMWKHSYFLQYKTKRPDYINAFWNIVNWNEVNKRFKKIAT